MRFNQIRRVRCAERTERGGRPFIVSRLSATACFSRRRLTRSIRALMMSRGDCNVFTALGFGQLRLRHLEHLLVHLRVRMDLAKYVG